MDHLLKSRGKRPRTGGVVQCENCKNEFYVAPGRLQRAKFCSYACKVIAQTHQAVRICAYCCKEFTEYEKGHSRYCSWQCYYDFKKPLKACAICGTKLQLNARTYCSKQCTIVGRRKGSEKPCEQCGVSMWVEPYNSAKRFCSVQCKNEGIKLKGPGAKVMRQDGYVQVYYPAHPDANSQGTILEHRLVAEQKYGRRILKSEHVHHLNHVRDDNRPENLEIVHPGDHARESNAHGKRLRKTMREELAEYRRRFGPLSQ
jgi:HNH endonuclease